MEITLWDCAQENFITMDTKELELKLIKFYHDIIDEEIILNPHSFKTCVKKLRRAYSKKIRKTNLSVISFTDASTRCAYIYNYCPCFTSATTFHFAQMLHKNPSVLEKILTQDALTVCCLGGGPASEIVAISMVLEKVLQKHQRQNPFIINAIIIDYDAGWDTTVKKVIEKLNQDMDQASVQSTYRFIQFDLLKPLTEDVKEAVRNSDVVTMVKVLSVVEGSADVNNGVRVIQETVECIPDGGIFFLLDSSGFKDFDAYDLIKSFEYMIGIYGTLKNNYRLLNSSRKCMQEFSTQHNMPHRIVFSCNKIGAWRKKSMIPVEDHV